MNSTPILESALPSMAPYPVIAASGLAAGTLWTVGASIAGALSQWLLLIVTAKLGSAGMVGQLAMSFALVAPVQALTDLALRPALATDAKGEFSFSDYLRLRLMMIGVFLCVVGAAALWRGGAVAPVIVAIGLQKAVESASDIFFGLFQKRDRLQWMGQSVMLRSALSSAAFIAVMLAWGDLLMACLAGWLLRLAVFGLHDYPRGSGLAVSEPPASAGLGKGILLKSTLPLALSMFLMSFSVNLPRYAVERRMGVAMLGVFAALVYFFQAGSMFIDALGQAACAPLARYHLLGQRRAFQILLGKTTGLALGAAGCGVLIALAGGGRLLRLAYSADFAVQSRPFLWLSVCAVPWYCSSVLGYGLVARRQMRALFYCQAGSLAASLAGSYWLIAEGGSLTAACRVVFLTYSVLLAFYSFVLWGRDQRRNISQ